MSHQDNITLIVATDNHYAILLGALIKSIEENHKTSEKIDLYIMDDGISESNRKKISQSTTPAVTTLYWFKTHEVLPPGIRIPFPCSSSMIRRFFLARAEYMN